MIKILTELTIMKCPEDTHIRSNNYKEANMKSLLIALLLSWSFNLPVSSAEQLKGSQFKVESIAEQLLFVTIRIETEKTDATGKVIKGVGTGFIVDYRWADKQALFIGPARQRLRGICEPGFPGQQPFRSP